MLTFDNSSKRLCVCSWPLQGPFTSTFLTLPVAFWHVLLVVHSCVAGEQREFAHNPYKRSVRMMTCCGLLQVQCRVEPLQAM